MFKIFSRNCQVLKGEYNVGVYEKSIYAFRYPIRTFLPHQPLPRRAPRNRPIVAPLVANQESV